MKWIGERISFVDHKAKTTIIIKAENIGWQRVAMGAWVFMWLAIGVYGSLAFTFKLSDQELIIMVGFMTFWTYYAFRVFRQFLWIMFGSENLKIDETALTLKIALGKYGKATPYYLENIKKIRVVEPKEGSFQAIWEASAWIRGGERIEFDYMGKLVRIGRKLPPQEVKLLFTLLTKRIDEQLRKKK